MLNSNDKTRALSLLLVSVGGVSLLVIPAILLNIIRMPILFHTKEPAIFPLIEECVSYIAPRKEVSYEQDPLRAKRLLQESHNYIPLKHFVTPSDPIAARKEERWTELQSAIDGTKLDRCDPLIFLGGYINNKGRYRVITIIPSEVSRESPFVLFIACHEWRKEGSDLIYSRWESREEMIGRFFVKGIESRNLRFFCGSKDLDNPGHFIIPFESDNSQGIIDGWVDEDGSIELSIRG